jgi:hypothetical protein
VEGLGVLHIAGIRVNAVEGAVVLVVVPRAEVVLLGIGVELLAGVEQIRPGGRSGCGIAAEHDTVTVVGVVVLYNSQN